MSKQITGKCACGQVSYKVDGPPIVVAHCHCEQCRRISGTGHSTGAMFEKASVEITGELGEFTYAGQSGATVTKAFCPSCGSPISGWNTNSPDHITLPVGTMDSPDDLSVQVVIFERDKPHWDEQPEDIMRFDTQPDWKPPE